MICAILMSKQLFTGGRLHRGVLWTFLILFLLSVYGRWLVDATPEPLRPAWWVFGPFILLTDLLNPVFFDRFWFFMFCICGVAICALFWVLGRGGWKIRAVSAAILASIIAAPFAVMFMYGPYSLRTVRVHREYELSWLTEPEGNFASAFKSAQREHDVFGCKYRLHGWGLDSRLYFGSKCRKDLWMYDPQGDMKPRRIQDLPFESGTLTKVTLSRNFRPMGDGGLAVSRVVEDSISREGKFRAFVIQDSLYGPYDVLVMQPAAQK